MLRRTRKIRKTRLTKAGARRKSHVKLAQIPMWHQPTSAPRIARLPMRLIQTITTCS